MKELTIRDAVEADIPSLSRLHVTTWNATHRGGGDGGPTCELRERQWREAFCHPDGSWFCLLVERADGALVGFAKGRHYDHADLPAFAGELNKIYLLPEYQRLGIGRWLVGHVVRRFLSQGIESMVLFGDARNPSCACWEALGGEPCRIQTNRSAAITAGGICAAWPLCVRRSDRMAFDRTVSALRRRARLLIIAGLLVMVVAALDPLEGSIVVVLGGGMVALGARLRGSRHLQYLYWCLAMLAVGVGALWGLSAVGGFGGTSGRSYLWGLLIAPYPIGWLAGLIGGVRALGEARGAA